MFGLGQEVREGALVQFGLADLAALQQLLAGVVEGAVQQGEEGEGLGGEDFAVLLLDGAKDVDALEDGLGRCHDSVGWSVRSGGEVQSGCQWQLLLSVVVGGGGGRTRTFARAPDSKACVDYGR